LAYVYNRLQRLKEIRWNLGPELAEDIQKALIEPEIQWFQNYNKLLSTYMASVGREHGLGVLKIDTKPPKSLYIEVRCVADYGRFELGNGDVVILKKNSQHYLPKSECEHLIRQGILEHIIH
jgi:GINS complex subunit 1